MKYLFLLFVITGCTQNPAIAPSETNRIKQNSQLQKQWATSVITHRFSDPVQNDTFRIVLTGDALLSAKAVFEIINFEGRQIYLDTFPALYLLGYETDISDTNGKKEAYILKRVKNFFQDGNFLFPAIGETEEMDPDYSLPDKAIWNELKSDRKKIGFHYLTGEENSQRIAYSKKLKKVVVYFSCC